MVTGVHPAQTADGGGDGVGRRILDAARAVFLSHGFEAALIDDIARDATVSKTTLYKRHASKRDLFYAVVRREAERVTPPFDPDAVADWAALPALVHIAERILRAFTVDERWRMERVLVLEVIRCPDLSCLCSQGVIDGELAPLRRYFTLATERGRLRTDDPDFVAMVFADALKGLYARFRLGAEGFELPDLERAGIAVRTARLLLNGIGGTPCC